MPGKKTPQHLLDKILKLSYDGLTITEIQDELGVGRNNIVLVRKKAGYIKPPGDGVNWTPEVRDKVDSMLRSGEHMKKIARVLGVCTDAVKQRRDKITPPEIRKKLYELSLKGK